MTVKRIEKYLGIAKAEVVVLGALDVCGVGYYLVVGRVLHAP